MNTKAALKELNIELHQLSAEALQILNILDQIEDHTAELRKKLMAELKQTNTGMVHLKLDNVDKK